MILASRLELLLARVLPCPKLALCSPSSDRWISKRDGTQEMQERWEAQIALFALRELLTAACIEVAYQPARPLNSSLADRAALKSVGSPEKQDIAELALWLRRPLFSE